MFLGRLRQPIRSAFSSHTDFDQQRGRCGGSIAIFPAGQENWPQDALRLAVSLSLVKPVVGLFSGFPRDDPDKIPDALSYPCPRFERKGRCGFASDSLGRPSYRLRR